MTEALSDKPVLLITGGNGLVGRNLRAHPGIKAWRVLAPGSEQLDLRDGAAVHAWMNRHRPDAVVHAAGVVGGIHANMAQPARFLADNALIGTHVITASRAAGVRVLINLASSCIYPRALGVDLSEDQILTGPLEPTNEGYALAKIMALRLCEYVMREDPGLHYKTLIPCNLYGPWDHFDPTRSHLLAAIIHKIHTAAREGADQVEIWGDGTARREFMYAGDLADAILRALKDPGSLPTLMNIGWGQDHSVNDYYRIAAEVIGWQGRFVHDLGRPVGMARKLMSVRRQQDWGWRPTTALHDGIRATWDFYQGQFG